MKTKKHHVRTLWLSDIHLGTKDCQYELLFEVLDYYKCDTIYLVGDIIDGWQLKRTTRHWCQGHTDIIRKLMSKARKGTKIRYITGNHDEFLRKFDDLKLRILANISIVDEDIYTCLDGRRLWIIHGDKYDVVVKYQRWIAVLGSIGYDILLSLNTIINKVRARFGHKYWSLSRAVKSSVKDAVNYISHFEEALSNECKKRNYDGVVCGHIHHATLRNDYGTQYWNCGDFVESCSGIIEEENGAMKVVQWKLHDGIMETIVLHAHNQLVKDA